MNFRFTIEPVSNEPLSPRRRARTASGGNPKQPPQVRLRRNAFSSASIASNDDFGKWIVYSNRKIKIIMRRTSNTNNLDDSTSIASV